MQAQKQTTHRLTLFSYQPDMSPHVAMIYVFKPVGPFVYILCVTGAIP